MSSSEKSGNGTTMTQLTLGHSFNFIIIHSSITTTEDMFDFLFHGIAVENPDSRNHRTAKHYCDELQEQRFSL